MRNNETPFLSLEQRMAQYYTDTFPKFVPDELAPVSVPEQEQFYDAMKRLYQLAFDEPLLFVSQLHEDDAIPNRFHKSSYGKPDLILSMRKFMKAVDTLLENMFLMGGGKCEVRLNKRQQVILARLGIEDFTNLPAAWTWMSARPGTNCTIFSRCFFKEGYPYTSGIYARLFGDEAVFRKLENWMLAQDYKRFDVYNVTASDCKVSMTYANPLWGTETPGGGFEYKIKHTGISARYDPGIRHPAVFGLCLPGGLKAFLARFHTMDKPLQDFVISRAKKCDGCRYCVQTDKTGSRPFACISVRHDQKEYRICPLFPGCYFCWTEIDETLADQLIAFLTFMDGTRSHA